MNSTERMITLPYPQVNSAIEEYLHRLKLIDQDEKVSLEEMNGNAYVELSLTKEATVH